MKPRILWADESTASATLARELLEASEFDVEAAPDALECLHLIEEFQPDLLVLDSNLAWGGMTVLDRLRRQPEEYRVPYVLIIGSEPAELLLCGEGPGSVSRNGCGAGIPPFVARFAEKALLSDPLARSARLQPADAVCLA
jgi:CheY-like chemotaxis protein